MPNVMPVAPIMRPLFSAVATSPWYMGTATASSPDPMPVTSLPRQNITIETDPALMAPPTVRKTHPAMIVRILENRSEVQAATRHPRKPPALSDQGRQGLGGRDSTVRGLTRSIESTDDVRSVIISRLALLRQMEVVVDCSDYMSAFRCGRRSTSMYRQFGWPTVDPMIERPYAVDKVLSPTKKTTRRLYELALTLKLLESSMMLR